MSDHNDRVRRLDKFFSFLKGPRPETPHDKSGPRSPAPPQTSPASRSVKRPNDSEPDPRGAQPSGSVSQPPQVPGITNSAAPDTDDDASAGENQNAVPRAQKSAEPGVIASEKPRRNLSKEAFNALPAETQDGIRKIIPNASSGADEFSSSVPVQVRALVEFVKSKEEECQKKFWKINIGGKDIVIKDYVKSTLDVLQQVGDIAIHFAPAPGSIVWSGVKTIIQMYANSEAELCALLMVAQSVTPILCRVQAYEPVFTASNTPQAHLNTLDGVAIKIYSNCFEILAYTIRELASKRRRARHSLLEPGRMTGMMSKLKDLESEHHSAVMLCHTISTSESMQEVQRELESLTELLAKNEKTLKNVEAGVDRLVSNAILDTLVWISPVFYMKDHIAIKKKRAQNTGCWLVQHPSFEHWKNSDSSALFWLQGTVGTGKSVLSSSVIDYFQDDFINSSEDGGFAYFYCNLHAPDHNETLHILRSCVRQLSTTIRSEHKMREELINLCEETKRKGGEGLDEKTCAEQIQDSVNLYPRTVIVLDGLDECEEDQRKMLLDVLDAILALAKVKVFIASRPTQDMEHHFACFDQKQAFRVDTADNLEDIKTYVTQTIKNPGKNWKDVPEKTRELVKTTLLEDSTSRRPMFRWVYLQLVQLLQCRSAPAIMDRLGKLPPDLNDSYDAIYQRNTEKLEHHDLAHVERAFLWVLGADPQPPSYVILQAVRFSTKGDIDDKVSKETLLDLCQHLLVIDSNSDRFQYSHASVKEWVESRHWKLEQAECHITKVCLSHLLTIHEHSEPLFNAPRKETAGSLRRKRLRYSIQDYIQLYWPKYVKAVNDARTFDEDLVRLLKVFLGSPMESSSQYRRWASWIFSAVFSAHTFSSVVIEDSSIETEDVPDPVERSEADINADADDSDVDKHSVRSNAWQHPFGIWPNEIEPSEIALFAMVAYGFTDILMEWWESADMDVNIKNSDHNALLSLARSLEVIKLLVKRGVDINTQFYPYGTVLARAVKNEDLETVKFLVDTGRAEVNVDFEMAEDSCVLDAATMYSLEILKYIVEHGGADVNRPFKSKYAGSALAMVAALGKLDAVKYLVNEAKADVNLKLQHGRFGNALVAAAHGGNLDVVQFFVNEKKVSVNEPVEYGSSGTALQAASAEGHEQVVRLLLKKNAAVNAQGGEFGTALHAASSRDYLGKKEAIIIMLLNKGADPNAQSEEHNSILYEASEKGQKEIVKILLDKDVNPNAQGKPYGNALQAASAQGHDVVVQMLLDKGANPNAQGGCFGNALEAASWRGQEVVVKILRERGVSGEYPVSSIDRPTQTGRFGGRVIDLTL